MPFRRRYRRRRRRVPRRVYRRSDLPSDTRGYITGQAIAASRYNRRLKTNNQFLRVRRYTQLTGSAGQGFYFSADWDITAPALVDSYAQYNFTFRLEQVPNYAEYTALYELYRLRHCKVTIQYLSSTEFFNNTAPVGGVAPLGPVGVMMFADPDDISNYANTGAGWRLAQESQRSKVKWFPNVKNNKNTRYVKTLKVLSDVSTGSTDTYAMARTSPWLSTAVPTVDHYGMKLFAQCRPGTVQVLHTFRIYVTYYVDFKMGK